MEDNIQENEQSNEVNNTENNQNNQHWSTTLSPEFQQFASKFENPEAMVKSYINAQALVGKKVEDFSKEDYQTYAAMMQQATDIPTDANGYKINAEGEETNCLSDDELAEIRERAHDLGLTTKQAQELYKMENEDRLNMQENVLNQTKSSYEELAKRWGNAANTKLKAVEHCVHNIFPQLLGCSSEQVVDSLQGVWNNPLLMEALAKIGELGTDSGNTGYDNLSPSDAALRLEQMKSDPRTFQALSNPMDPRHKEVKQEFRTLLAIKHGA